MPSTVTLSQEADGGIIRRTTLPSGLRVITEAMPGVRSVAFGIWVGVGSRDETPPLAGASHFLEHLLFKGTKKRSALEIAAAMDAVGGEMNAFTTKEFTVYYARVLDTDLPLAVDLLSDMVTASQVATSDVESERGVILEEIAMHDDAPDDMVHDSFAKAIFGEHPLGRPVLGSVQSITDVSRTAVHGYWRKRYRPETMVIAAAGNLKHDTVMRLVRKAFGAEGTQRETTAAVTSRGTRPGPDPVSRVESMHRPTEQANVVLGRPGLQRHDDRRFALGVLNNAFGGGMSSRLFQEIREKRGLVYSVYSYHSQFADAGLFGIYAGCAPNRVDDVLALCREQIDQVLAKGITDEEMRRAKGQLKGSLVLGLEDTGSRMSRLGKAELVYNEFLTVDEAIRCIDAVTLDEVKTIAHEVLAGPLGLAVIGPFQDRDFAPAVA